MPLIQDLSRYVANFPKQLPSEVLDRARIVLLDSLACAVAALNEPVPQSILRMVRDTGGSAQCTVIGQPWRTSLPQATFANGMLIRTLDFNDFTGGLRITGHPSDNIAVALAAGEMAGRSNAEVLTAIVLAYELYGWLQNAIAPDSPWDHVTVSGLVAPAITARMLGFNLHTTAHALALGAAHAPASAGLRDGNVSGAKILANAIVAQQGAQAALLAAAGVTGPLGVLESRRGLGLTVFTEAATQQLRVPQGGAWRIMESHIKAYPCVATAQALVAAAQSLRANHAFLLSDVTRISVVMADVPMVRAHLNDDERRNPHSREAADHSFNFLLAVTLADGVLSARQFESERWKAPDISGAMAQIEYDVSRELADRAPNSFAAALTVETRDGRRLGAEVLFAPGHARNPFTFHQAAEKFRACAGNTRIGMVREDVVNAVGEMKLAGTLGGLMSLLSRSTNSL